MLNNLSKYSLLSILHRKARALVCLIVPVFLYTTAIAQKENNTWYFGDGLGLNFNSTPPTPLTNGATSAAAIEGCASVSDSNGRLLFYSDCASVYTRNHNLMANGDDIKGDYSSTQGAAIVKKPGSNNLYYLFNVNERFFTLFGHGLAYNVIDMSKNGGDGEVILKNIPLIKNFGSEKLVIVKDAFGCGFWIITHNLNTGTYYSFHLNSTGLDTVAVKSKIGFSSTTLTNPGYLKASMDGKKLAAAFFHPQLLELFDFDNLTGIVSNHRAITRYDRFYGVSFSTDNKYLYASTCNNTGTLYQYDVSLPTASAISASEEIIFTGLNAYGALQAGPDGLIYVSKENATSGKYYLGVIKYPNKKGQLCEYIDTGVYISAKNKNKMYGLPNLVESARPFNLEFELGKDTVLCTGQQFEIDGAKNIDGNFLWSTGDTGKTIKVDKSGVYKLTVSSLCGTYTDSIAVKYGKQFTVYLGKDTVLCAGQQFEIDDAKNIDGSFLWSTGDTGKTIKVNKPGLYTLTIFSLCGTYTGSIAVKYGKPFTVYLGNDTAFCGMFSHLLDARKGAQKYLWNTGDTTVTLLVNKPNMYAVIVKDTNSCTTGDTINIGQLNKPVITLKLDTITCQYVYLSIPQHDTAIKYNWSTGDTGIIIKAAQKGNYSVTLSNKFCSISTTVAIDKLPAPEVELGPDTSICDGSPIQIDAGDDGEKYRWNTKDTTRQITVIKEGLYKVTVTRNHCSKTDSVWVGPVCDMWYYIPTAFTPGRDAKNDVFEVAGEYIKHIEIQIFDRWGGQIYSGSGTRPQWDGSYKSIPCADGVYIYLISVTGYKRGHIVKENLSGNLTLLR